MKKTLLFLVAVFVFYTGFSQVAPAIQWQNTIGGSDFDASYKGLQTFDGGYILGGISKSNISGDKTENCNGIVDYWIMKTDSSGNIQWQNTIGGNDFDVLNSIEQTTDSGYILGGHSTSNISGDKSENCIGSHDYWIVKVDALGNIQWQQTIGGNATDYLYTVKQTSDAGYILGGHSVSGISGDKTEYCIGGHDYWIVKIDSIGNIQWQNTIGGMDTDEIYSLEQTTDGGYILGGYSESYISGDKTENCIGGHDFWVVKIDVSGNIQWQNTIGGNDDDALKSIQQTSDGGYILGGYSGSNISGDKTENCIGHADYWLVKTDSTGIIQWQNTIGGNDVDYLKSIRQTLDGGYVFGGWSISNVSGDKTENSNGEIDCWILKTDAMGNIQWQNTFGGSDDDYLWTIEQTQDGGFILSGGSYSSISGDKTENCLGVADYWIVKLAPDTITGISNFEFHTLNFQISPNPADEYSVISYQFAVGDIIRVTDVLGKTIFTKTIAAPTLNFKLQTIHYTPGIYFVEVITEKEKAVRKVVKQ